MIGALSHDSLVQVHRDDRSWYVGFGSSLHADQLPELHVHTLVARGDRLTFGPETWQSFIDFVVVDHIGPLPCPIRVTVLSSPACPSCGTVEPHEIEIPDALGIVERYVLRTCAVCSRSWEQQA